MTTYSALSNISNGFLSPEIKTEEEIIAAYEADVPINTKKTLKLARQYLRMQFYNF